MNSAPLIDILSRIRGRQAIAAGLLASCESFDEKENRIE